MTLSFLKKLGQILLKVTEVITGAGPLIQALVPNAAPTVRAISSDLAAIAGIIVQVEAVGQILGTPGADKLRAATPLVAQAILQSSILVDRKIENPALFEQGARKIADGMADLLNSLKADVETENKAGG